MRPRVLVTHHHYAQQAIELSKDIGARSVLVVHNDHDQPALTASPDLLVYNTEWIVRSLASRYPEVDRIRSLVVHPPVIPEEHRAPNQGRHVTLVNLNRHKGVDTWRNTAALLGSLPFLGVRGAHGKQILRPVRPNMRIIHQTSNMRNDVWAQTRVLMMPSIYESYGMAAVEALASGIPVIAHPTPGLKESMGQAGTFVDRSDSHAWAKAVKSLYYNGARRAEASAAALARSTFLADQATMELKLWVHAVQELAGG